MGVTTPCRGRVAELLVELQRELSRRRHARLPRSERRRSRARSGSTRPPRRTPANRRPTRDGGSTHGREDNVGRANRPCAACPCPRTPPGASYMSPRMKARMNELGLHAADLAGIAGSGAAGRVTIEDFEKFLAQLEQHKLSPASSMRVAVADAMRRSWTRPLATVGIAGAHRRAARASQSERPKAGPRALRAARPGPGARRKQRARRTPGREQIVHPQAIDVGFAVEAEDGVLVPVLRDVDQTAAARTGRALQRTRRTGAPAPLAAGRAPAAPSPPSPTSAPSASTGPRPFRCPNKRWCSGMGAGRVRAALGRSESNNSCP